MDLRRLLACCFIICCSFSIYGQSDQETQVKKELSKQGVDVDELNRRLIERGFNADEIDPNNPNQILEFQRVSEEIIAEMKAEKDSVVEIVKSNSENITAASESDTSATETSATETSISIPTAISTKEKAKVKIYGHQIYREGSVRYYKENEYINPPSNYILGPGDKITVSIWGNAEENFSQEISNDGYVKFTQIPRITLSGLTLKDAKVLVRSKLKRNYPFRDEDYELKVTSTRNINVVMTGEVFNVGSYNISAVNPAVNALAAAGGPSEIGSVRNIKIASSTGNKTLDLYKFLSNPQLSDGLFLKEGDYIIVPVLGKVVEIKGAIRRPFKYELQPNETLEDLIKFAGGLEVSAFKKNVKIIRYQDDEKIILNLDISDKRKVSNFKLMDGDVIDILSIDDQLENVVNVEGAINNTGQFSLTDGMKISELMTKVDLKKDAILDIAYLVRQNDDQKTVKWQIINLEEAIRNPNSNENISLQNNDKITIRGKSLFVRARTISVKGAVNSEISYQLDEARNLKVSDAVFLAGGLSPQATDFAYIIRNLPGATSPEYISVNIKEAIEDQSSNSNINLEPNDILQVYSLDQYIDDTYVNVQGAVRQPNRYKYDESLTLKDALLLSNGLTMSAARNNIDIFRLELNGRSTTRTLVATASVSDDLSSSDGDFKLQPFDQIVVRQAAGFEFQREVYITGEVNYPGKYFILDDNFKLADLIKEAGGLTKEAFEGGVTLKRTLGDVGYVVVDFEEAMKKPKSGENLILQKGDNINIPKMENLVSVEGAVNRKSALRNIEDGGLAKVSFAYDSGLTAKDYINKSGGFAENSDKSSLVVVYPNGEVHKTKRILFFRNYPKVVPGSKIVVDYNKEKIENAKQEKEDIDWGVVLRDSIAQATAILSLILLIDRID